MLPQASVRTRLSVYCVVGQMSPGGGADAVMRCKLKLLPVRSVCLQSFMFAGAVVCNFDVLYCRLGTGGEG